MQEEQEATRADAREYAEAAAAVEVVAAAEMPPVLPAAPAAAVVEVASAALAAPAASDAPAAAPAPSPDASVAATEREINAVWKEADGLYHDVAVSMGLSDSAFDILYSLREAGDGCLQRDICEYSYQNKQTINSSIHRMVDQGLVRLEACGHGRGKHVYLTPAGRELIERCVDPVMEAEHVALSALSAEQREAFCRTMRAYVHELRKCFADIPGMHLADQPRSVRTKAPEVLGASSTFVPEILEAPAAPDTPAAPKASAPPAAPAAPAPTTAAVADARLRSSR